MIPIMSDPTALRATWDEYFMKIAEEVATRATCDRRHVGAVLARDRSILATGYNGSVRGLPHCDDAGHLMRDGHCVRTVHAEANAVAQAARNGVRIDGSTLYCTILPCLSCMQLLANAGVLRIVYGGEYHAEIDAMTIGQATAAGIAIVRLDGADPILVNPTPIVNLRHLA
jgi:dCMP deaminase